MILFCFCKYVENEKEGKMRPSRAMDLFRRSKSRKEVKGKGKAPATDNDAADDEELVFLSQKDYELDVRIYLA
jgi:hypothetical protein